MHLQIDIRSRTPIYVQIIECVKKGIASGELSAGTQLPPVRVLAYTLNVSKLTVERAYTELQEAGLITGRPGRGTTISPLKESAIPRIIPASSQEGDIVTKFRTENRQNRNRNFATTGPDPELFDYESWLDAVSQLRKDGAWNFFYPNDLGEPAMIQAGVELLRRYRTRVDEEQIVVLGRGSEIISRLGHGLIERGSHVLIQEPHTLGSEELFSSFGFVAHGVAVTDKGIDLDQIQLLVKIHPIKVAFVEPTFGYSDGKVWSESNRRSFIRLMQKHDVLVVERLAAAAISFMGEIPPTLASLSAHGNIISELPLSDSIAPGLGVGVAALPVALMPWFQKSRQQTGMTVNVTTQLAMAQMVTSGRYISHFNRVTPIYQARRDALVKALNKDLPYLKTTVPSGGLALEIIFPRPIDANVLFEATLTSGVPIMPTRFLTTRGRGNRTARITYGLMSPEMIRSAIAKLAPVLENLIELPRKTGTI